MKKDAVSNKSLQTFEQAKIKERQQFAIKGGGDGDNTGTGTPPPPPGIGTDDLINGRG